jgi:predicted ArsR family transcriptional regulator
MSGHVRCITGHVRCIIGAPRCANLLWTDLAHRLEVTPQWVRQLRTRLVAAGELMVQQSRGRHPNVYRIPYEDLQD